jgi:hypothetical protein
MFVFKIVNASPNLIWVMRSQKMRWVGYVARGGEEKVVKFLWGNLKKSETYAYMEYNNEMDLKETGCECVGWTHMARDTDKWRVLVERKTKCEFRQRCGWGVSSSGL